MIQHERSGLQWNGATQNERMLKALAPEYIKIDERSISDFLAFAYRYADMVKYHSLKSVSEFQNKNPQLQGNKSNNNKAYENWRAFFDKNIAVFLASIIATDLKKYERSHAQYILELEHAPRLEDRLEALEKLYVQVLEMAKDINSWYKTALEMNALEPGDTDELENELENAIKQQLSKNLDELFNYNKELEFQPHGDLSENHIRSTFHRIWFRSGSNLLQRALDTETIDIEDKIQEYTKKIRIQFRTFYSVIAYIVQIAPKYLQEALTQKDDHRPDIALFIAFLHLFQHNQNQLNTLTEKHLDFYYYDVLKLKERGLSPDQINTYFQLGQQLDKFFLPEGTLLNAGTDEAGNPIHYKTDIGIELNHAKIASAKTLFISKNSKIAVGSSYKLITNLYAAPVANSRDGLGERFINDEEEWPVFGEELLEKPENERQSTFADIGWAIAAPILEMEEGHRVVTMKMEFEKSSMYTLNLLIKDKSKNENISKEDAFSNIFRDSLNVFFTTEEGWVQANTCELLPPEDWSFPEITLVATIASSSPAIVGYNTATFGNEYNTNAPVMKIVHQNQDVVFTYSFLKELMLEKVVLDVTVQGIKHLKLFNEFGLVEGSIPFQPFGAIPKVGSYLLIGKAELFKKDLTDLQVNMEWHNLPDHKKGLRGYYKEYGLGINNDSYKVRLSALSEGEFFPAAEDNLREYRLFEEHEEDRLRIAEETIFDDVDLKAFNIKPDYNLELPSTFNNEIRSGYLKLELTSPAVGFGQDDYSTIYAKIVAYNANPKRKGPELPLPKQPWTPVVRSLTLDYSATAQINILSIGRLHQGEAAVEQLYHIHPFGVIKTFDKGRPSNRRLLPTYNQDAYLYLGVKDLNPPSNLSIYFELKENQDYYSMIKGKSSETQKPEIIWSYMVNNEWKEFSQNQILSDTTFNFNNSGIVTFDIPRDVNTKNQILPEGLHWLRASLKGNASRMPHVLHMATQAVSATWVMTGAEEVEHLKTSLGPNSVKGLVTSMSQIRSVKQPFASFSGRPGETKKEFYTRSSERLRHKGRAVSAWDYERLVLEKFPDIFQVKCVTHLGNEQFVKKGAVTIVVVPRLKHGQKTLPMVNNATLEAIHNYLKPLASPFVTIEVRNPIYERVKISAGVRFEKGQNNGNYLKKLNQDIMQFMCPWMYGESKELELGGLVAKDVLLSFIEKRPYLEFVTKFSAVQVFPTEEGFDVGDTAIDNSSSPVIRATCPWSVLIPFQTNPIYLIDEVTFQSPEKAGIDSMMLDGDFVMTIEKDYD